MMKASANPCTPNPTGTVAHVGIARFYNGVEVPVDDPVEVLGDLVGHFEQLVVIKGSGLRSQTWAVQRKRGYRPLLRPWLCTR